jgi:hypothetical protein
MPDNQEGQAALDIFLDMWVTGTTNGRRAPILRRPGEVGLEGCAPNHPEANSQC